MRKRFLAMTLGLTFILTGPASAADCGYPGDCSPEYPPTTVEQPLIPAPTIPAPTEPCKLGTPDCGKLPVTGGEVLALVLVAFGISATGLAMTHIGKKAV